MYIDTRVLAPVVMTNKTGSSGLVRLNALMPGAAYLQFHKSLNLVYL